MDSVGKTINSFKDPEQLKQFADSLYRQTIELSKENEELKEHVHELKQKLSENTAKVVVSSMSSMPNINVKDLLSLEDNDQEMICRSQLAILRSSAMNRELTLEEARKIEIYSKVLNGIKPKEVDESEKVKDNPSDNLVLLLSNGKDDK
jgi:cell division septum initiation protein DivIVA